MSVLFAGKNRVIPGAYSEMIVQSTTPKGGTYPRTVAVLGPSTGGEPGKVLRFADPVTAHQTLRGGNLLKACELAWNPAPGYQGADQIIAIRTQTALQSSYSLKDSLAAAIIDVTSLDYGAWTKNIRLKIENGSSNATYAGVKKVTIENQLKPGDYEIGDDLGKAIRVKYGVAEVCTMDVTVANGKATAITIDATTAANDLSIDLTLPAFDTLSKVVDYINSQANYEAALDGFDAASCELEAPAAPVDIQQKWGYFVRVRAGVIAWLNTSQYVSAAAKSATGSEVPANMVWTNLAGGDDGSESAANWTAALDLLLGEPDVAYVVPCCGDTSLYASAQAMVQQHVAEALSTANIRRRGFFGAEAGVTDAADVKAAVSSLHNYRSSFYAPGIKQVDENGTLQTYGAWASAAIAAGLSVGLATRSSLTFKYINAPALERKYTRAEIIELLEAGIVPLQEVSGRGCRFVQGLTTDLTSGEFYTEQSNIDIADYIVGTLEQELEDRFVGNLANTDLVTGVQTMVHSFLQQQTDDGLLAGDDSNPAFRNIQVSIDGTVVNVSYEASVAKPANWILQTAHFTPVRISA